MTTSFKKLHNLLNFLNVSIKSHDTVHLSYVFKTTKTDRCVKGRRFCKIKKLHSVRPRFAAMNYKIVIELSFSIKYLSKHCCPRGKMKHVLLPLIALHQKREPARLQSAKQKFSLFFN